MYSDAHTHLTGPVFGDLMPPDEIKTVLQQARDAGVAFVVASGQDLARSIRVTEIAVEYDMVYAAIGLHPWIVVPIDDETYQGFLDLAKNSKVVAVGEIGLDEYRSQAGKTVQIEALIRQLELAQETDLPVFLHERGFHDEMLDVLSRHTPRRGVMHGFRGTLEELKLWLDFGFYFTIGRTVLEPDGKKLETMVAQIPEERLLLETDGVDTIENGTIEGPARVVELARTVGQWRGTSGEAIGKLTTNNLKNLLGI